MKDNFKLTIYYDFDSDYELDNKEKVHITKLNYPYDVTIDYNRAYDEFIAIYNEYYRKALAKAAIDYLEEFGHFVAKGEKNDL